MEKKNLDWSNLGFSYMKTDKRYVANYTAKAGKWDEGALIDDDKIVMSEDAGVLQYSQSVFEGLKAYTTKDGHIVCFRPDLNAQRMYDSAQRLEMPPLPVDQFVDSITFFLLFSLKYLSSCFIISSSTFLIFRKSWSFSPSRFCIANCSSTVFVP